MPQTRHDSRTRFRHSIVAGPPLAGPASRLVPLPARRLDPLRREPAEEISGYRQSGFLLRRPGRALERAVRHRAVLDRSGRAYLPRRQSSHQAVRILGMADPRGANAASRRDLPGRGVHPAESDEGSRQAGILAILHLFHLADGEIGAAVLSERADRLPGAGIFPAEFFRQYAGHPAVPSAVWRSGDLQIAHRARGNAIVELRRLQRVRAHRAHADPRPRFFFNYAATPDIYPLPLHDALPI